MCDDTVEIELKDKKYTFLQKIINFIDTFIFHKPDEQKFKQRFGIIHKEK